jgi:hypothetical protein
MIASGQLTVLQGLYFGYNVEQCSEISIKGLKLTHCVKLTKPATEIPKEPSARH